MYRRVLLVVAFLLWEGEGEEGGSRYNSALRAHRFCNLCAACFETVSFVKGWYLEAESYLVTTSRLLAGLRLDKIVLRDRAAPGEY